MDTKQIFEEAKGALLEGDKHIEQMLFIELAGAGDVVLPISIDPSVPIDSTADRVLVMLVSGRKAGQQFQGDTVRKIAIAQMGWICKVLPGKTLPAQAERDPRRCEVVAVTMLECVAHAYSMQSAEVVRSAKGKVTACLTSLMSSIDLCDDVTLEAALAGYNSAHLDDTQFESMKKQYIFENARRRGDAWGIMTS